MNKGGRLGLHQANEGGTVVQISLGKKATKIEPPKATPKTNHPIPSHLLRQKNPLYPPFVHLAVNVSPSRRCR